MIKNFFRTIWRASTDAFAYVDDFSRRRAGSGLGYLFWLVTATAFLGILPFAIAGAFTAHRSDDFANGQLAILREWYPAELAVTISGGVLSTNVEEPYVLDLPAEWRTGDEGEPVHAIVIDTDASVDDFATYDTMVLLTDRAAVARDDNGLRVFPFDDFEENVTIDKALVDEGVLAVSAYTPALPWIIWSLIALAVLVFPWIAGGVLWLMQLFFLAWSTVLLWIAAALMGRGLRYGELFRLGLFGVTSSYLVGVVEGMFGVDLWLSWLVFFGWMIYVISRFPRRAKIIVSAPPPPASELPAKKPAAKKAPAKRPKA